VGLTYPTRVIRLSRLTKVVVESRLDFRSGRVESAAEKDWVWLGLGWLGVEMEGEFVVVELDGPFPLLVEESPKEHWWVMVSWREQVKW
jgi:hypothetical protein